MVASDATRARSKKDKNPMIDLLEVPRDLATEAHEVQQGNTLLCQREAAGVEGAHHNRCP